MRGQGRDLEMILASAVPTSNPASGGGRLRGPSFA